MMKYSKSTFKRKRFFLYAFLTLIMLIILIFVNAILSYVRAQNLKAEQNARFDAFVEVYHSDYSAVAQSLYNLSNNSLVQNLRYNSTYSTVNATKCKALISALGLANSAWEDKVLFFVYFHDSDRVASDGGFLWVDEFKDKYQIGDDFNFEHEITDRSGRIGIFRQAVVYKSYTYSYRSSGDNATLYTYTSNGATVMALLFDAGVYDSIDQIMRTVRSQYVVWDSVTGYVLFSNMNEIKERNFKDQTIFENMMCNDESIQKYASGRFVWYMREESSSTDIGIRITLCMFITSIAVFIMMVLYYLTLEKSIFQPLKHILKSLPVSNKPIGMYEQIEDALRKIDKDDKNEVVSIENRITPSYEELLSQSLLGVRKCVGDENDRTYLCVGVAAETELERQTAVDMVIEKMGGKLLCVFAGFSILFLSVDTLDEDGVFKMLKTLNGRVAVGVSCLQTSISNVYKAYQQSADVFRMPCDGLPLVYNAGTDTVETVLGLPLDAHEAEMLLSNILKGNCDKSMEFVNELLDKTAHQSIDRKRYVARFLLYLFELAQNGVKNPLYNTQEMMDALGGTIDFEVMRAIVNECCENLTRFYTPADDRLIVFVKDYVEQHYQDNINLQSVTQISGFSYAYVSHFFSEKMNLSFTDYLNSVRIEKAKELLERTDMMIGDISEQIGFGSMNTFARNFRKFTGTTPDAYRKLVIQNNFGERENT